MNIEQARFNMIEQQIRTWEVLDPQVLDLLFEVKREDFAPAEHRELAFALSEGSEQRAPMGQAVIGGVVTSSLLTLVVVPVVYCYLDDFSRWVKRRVFRRPVPVLPSPLPATSPP